MGRVSIGSVGCSSMLPDRIPSAIMSCLAHVSQRRMALFSGWAVGCPQRMQPWMKELRLSKEGIEVLSTA